MTVKLKDDNVFRRVLLVSDASVGHFGDVVHRRHDADRHVIVAALAQRSVIQEAAVGSIVSDDKLLVCFEPIFERNGWTKYLKLFAIWWSFTVLLWNLVKNSTWFVKIGIIGWYFFN